MLVGSNKHKKIILAVMTLMMRGVAGKPDGCGCVDDAHGCEDVRLPKMKVSSNAQTLTMLRAAITAMMSKVKMMHKKKKRWW